MNKRDYFLEKSQQVDPAVVQAFGVKLSSRYGKADEISEMLSFAKYAADSDLHGYIQEVFYDSKTSVCHFEFCSTLTRRGDEERQLYAIACSSISKFCWYGAMGHGR